MSTREASAGKSITVSEIAITGVCIALTFVATGFINIRLPIAANGGLVHLEMCRCSLQLSFSENGQERWLVLLEWHCLI